MKATNSKFYSGNESLTVESIRKEIDYHIVLHFDGDREKAKAWWNEKHEVFSPGSVIKSPAELTKTLDGAKRLLNIVRGCSFK
jgi:hypothetical protein